MLSPNNSTTTITNDSYYKFFKVETEMQIPKAISSSICLSLFCIILPDKWKIYHIEEQSLVMMDRSCIDNMAAFWYTFFDWHAMDFWHCFFFNGLLNCRTFLLHPLLTLFIFYIKTDMVTQSILRAENLVRFLHIKLGQKYSFEVDIRTKLQSQ